MFISLILFLITLPLVLLQASISWNISSKILSEGV